jgi:hypothetical protein
MKTKEKSNIGEAKIMTHLLERGFAVLVPWGDNERYDLVSEKDGVFTKIQVKTVSLKEGIIKIDLRSSHRKEGKVIHHNYDSKQIDEFMVYCLETDGVYKLPITEVEGMSTIHLRVSSPEKMSSNIRLASKYIQQ